MKTSVLTVFMKLIGVDIMLECGKVELSHANHLLIARSREIDNDSFGPSGGCLSRGWRETPTVARGVPRMGLFVSVAVVE